MLPFLLLLLLPLILAAVAVPNYPHTPTAQLDFIAPPSIPLPKPIFKQTTRKAIVARLEAKARNHKARQAQAQASQRVYPTCDPSQTGYAPIEGSGFANLSPYYISRTAPYDVPGSWRNVRSALECIALCQQVGGDCSGVYWDSSPLTCSRRTGGIPPGSAFASRTGGVMAIRGTCAEISAKVNNPTIMASCCDAPPPPSTLCTDSTLRGLGQNCVRSRIQLANNNGLNSAAFPATRNVAATSARAGYVACTGACQQASSWAYGNQTANAQCLGVMYDHTKSLNANTNCYLQGGNLAAMTVTTNGNMVTFMAGRCEQQNAGTATYPAAYRNTAGCNSEDQIPAT